MKTPIIRLIFLLLLITSLPSYALSIASWNLEWLTTHYPKNSTLTIPKRSSSDFDKLNQVYQQLDIDILAFQEVNDVHALKKVIGHQYKIILSDRSKIENKSKQYNDINQYTGFAIRKNLKFSDPKDIVLSSFNKLRFGTYIILQRENVPDTHLLSIHLKSGCFGQWHPKKKSCHILKQQGSMLNHWIRNREINHQPFIILGDFNHNLAYPQDWLWRNIKNQLHRSLNLATSKTQSDCMQKGRKGHLFKYHRIIDHIVTSLDINLTNVYQIPYPIDMIKHYNLSDHCPLNGQLK